MRIAVQCSCGKVLQVDTRFAGTTRKCVFCSRNYNVPSMDAAALSSTIVDGEVNNVVATMYHRSDTRPQWSMRYWWMILALLPLLYLAFNREETNFLAKIEEAKQSMTEADKERLQLYETAAGPDGSHLSKRMLHRIMFLLPEHKIPGALLPYDSWGHWLFAFLSAGAFLALSVTLFPSRTTEPKNLLMVGFFTATAGIMLLLIFQFVAFANLPIGGNGILILIVLIIKAIGFSYMAAMDPQYGFFASLLGFTFGVGLCEEFCKTLPIFWHFKRKTDLDWRGACGWGLASGIGFGVSEGIMYSSSFYNGLLGSDIYFVRFISCVALHAIWAASAGISLWKNQKKIQHADTLWETFVNMITIIFVPMLLHGLYDTLLKKDLQLAAVLIAFLSFAWMAWTIEDAKKHEVLLDNQPATSPAY